MLLKKKFFIFTILLLNCAFCFGQDCTHEDLSNTLDFRVNVKQIKVDDIDSSIIKVTVRDKKTKKILHSKYFSSYFIYGNSFKNCNSVRSYITGKNKKTLVYDGDYGDLVVADFNFDGKDDFA